MNHDPKLFDEEGRLAALRRYAVLDTAPEAPFDKLTELVRRTLGVPIAAVSLIDVERQWFKAFAGLTDSETTREVSFCAHAIRQRVPLMINDATADARFVANPLVTGEPFIRSYLGIPLETPDGYNIGALCAIDTRPRDFAVNEVAILSSFAKLVLNELELRQIASSDGLTGAMTRRAWVEAAAKEMSRSRRHGVPVSVVVFDIDHFKRVNDLHGHPAGDAVLRTVSRRCIDAMRDSDMLGRIGGEEFALLLPATDTRGAMEVAERLRATLADRPVMLNGAPLPVTASFGVSGLVGSMNAVEDWLAVADGFLYAAKSGGRNCCRGALPQALSA